MSEEKLKKYVCIILCAFLSACGGGEIENAIKGRLKDPASAQFRNQLINNDLKLACVEWTAKNGFGGYGEWTVAELQKVDGKWEVLDIEGSRQYGCDGRYLQNKADLLASRVRGAAASQTAQVEATRMLAQGRHISKSEAQKLIDNDPDCKKMVDSYSYNAKAIAVDHIAEATKKYADSGLQRPDGDLGKALAKPPSTKNAEEMARQREALKAGSCSAAD